MGNSHVKSLLLEECAPGQYKEAVNTDNHLCSDWKRDECVLCPGNKIKSVSGDSSSLCQDVCNGTTNVPNAAHTTCGE